MPRHHVIISGTGRAGTTFLMQLFTELGLDTGFRNSQEGISPNCNAGMELDLRQPFAPYIVKSPWLCGCLDDVLAGGKIVIDHAFIPMRDLHAAAESRRRVTATSDPDQFDGIVPGGLWLTDDPDKQEDILAHQFYKLLHGLAQHDVPVTLLDFPRFVHDPEYLYKKASLLLRRIRYGLFLKAFRRVCRPELVHDFQEAELFTAATQDRL